MADIPFIPFSEAKPNLYALEETFVESYGAVGDMKYALNAAITSGTPTLTASGAGFTPSDLGKPIVVNDAGASGVPLITTISTYISPHSVTLATNASSTVAGALTPISANRLCYWGTDDTAAFQSAINDAAVEGGVINLGAKNYMVGELTFPARLIADYPFQTIYMRGVNPPPGRHWNDVAEIVPLPIKGFSCVQFYKGTGSLLTVASGLSGPSPTAISLNLEKINFRVPVLKPVTGLDLRRMGTANLLDVTVDTAWNNYSTHPQPVGGSKGVLLPQEYNAAQSKACNLAIANFESCLYTFEHAELDDIWIFRYIRGLMVNGGSHAQMWGHVQLIWGNYGLWYADPATGIARIQCRLLDFEDQNGGTGGWAAMVSHIEDGTNQIFGRVGLHRVVAFTGYVTGWTKVGASGLQVEQFGAPPTLLREASTASTKRRTTKPKAKAKK